jgi:two-component system chemotaxis response regulator CheB
MPPTFTKILAERLEKSGSWVCREGVHGEEIMPGVALIAPGGKHMLVKKLNNKYVIEINDDPPENYCRPAVDPLFRSLSKAYGGAILAVVLTGMGNDGTKGGQDIIDAGGTIVAQDEETSVVWGMPGSVTNAGLCSKLVSKEDMAGYINNFVARF